MTDTTRADETARKAWMSTLAKAPWDRLGAFWSQEDPKPEYEYLREPDVGLVMLRGRMGGSGAPFNFGEATVTRCSVRLPDGVTGHGYVMGRNKAHAEAAAVLDAMLQLPEHSERITRDVIEPLAREHSERQRMTAAKAAATKVDFFTMVRGED